MCSTAAKSSQFVWKINGESIDTFFSSNSNQLLSSPIIKYHDIHFRLKLCPRDQNGCITMYIELISKPSNIKSFNGLFKIYFENDLVIKTNLQCQNNKNKINSNVNKILSNKQNNDNSLIAMIPTTLKSSDYKHIYSSKQFTISGDISIFSVLYSLKQDISNERADFGQINDYQYKYSNMIKLNKHEMHSWNLDESILRQLKQSNDCNKTFHYDCDDDNMITKLWALSIGTSSTPGKRDGNKCFFGLKLMFLPPNIDKFSVVIKFGVNLNDNEYNDLYDKSMVVNNIGFGEKKGDEILFHIPEWNAMRNSMTALSFSCKISILSAYDKKDNLIYFDKMLQNDSFYQNFNS